MATKPAEKGADTLPVVSVQLLGPISTLKGHSWPHGYDWAYKKPDQPLLSTSVDTPHELIIKLPSGRIIRHISKLTFFNQYNGRVGIVKLIPNMNLLPFQQAVAELQKLLTEWDAMPKERSKADMAHWKKYGDIKTGPGSLSIPGGAVLRGESKADLFFQIRPGDGGWFLSITVGPTVDELEKLLQPSKTSDGSTKPME